MRSTNRAPETLSNSYFTGSPPTGTSMMTLMLSGGSLPTGMRSMFMMGRAYTRVDSLSHPKPDLCPGEARSVARPAGPFRPTVRPSPDHGHATTMPSPRARNALRGAAYEQGPAADQRHPGYLGRGSRPFPQGGGDVRPRAPALCVPARRDPGLRGDRGLRPLDRRDHRCCFQGNVHLPGPGRGFAHAPPRIHPPPLPPPSPPRL